MRSRCMLVLSTVCLFVLLLAGDPTQGHGQQLRDTFCSVQRSVVVVRTVKETVASLPQQGMLERGQTWHPAS